MGWRYLLTRLDGAGGEQVVHPELPLSDARVLDTLSAAPLITGTLTPEIASLRDGAGRPIIQPWSSAIYAEADGVIRTGGIVTALDMDDEQLTVTATGFLDYPTGQAWIESPGIYYEADPAVVYRQVWARLQARTGGNLGLTFDPLVTPVRVGKRATGVQGEPGATSDDPVLFAVYSTTDLGKQLEDLLVAGSIEVRERHAWSTVPGRLIDHHVEMVYPRRGRRLDLRFVIGENVLETPKVIPTADAYASTVVVIGAGEGPAAICQAYAYPPQGRLARSVVVSRQDLATKQLVNAHALQQLNSRSVVHDDIDQIIVRDTPYAPVTSVTPGDEIVVEGDAGWAGRSLRAQVRVISIEYSPQASASAVLKVVPSAKAYA